MAAELVEFRMMGRTVFTRPIAKKKGATNAALWKCGKCASGTGTCCLRRPESLPKAGPRKSAERILEDAAGGKEALARQRALIQYAADIRKGLVPGA